MLVDRYTNRGGNREHDPAKTAPWMAALWEYEALAQSDRGLALFACSALEEAMRHALEALFVRDADLMQSLFEDGNAPLMAGSARRKMLRAMGVIDAAADRDIAMIAKIRNRFGHRTTEGAGRYLSFEEESIRSMCNSLYLPQIMLWLKLPTQITHYWSNVSAIPQLSKALFEQNQSMPAREKYWRSCHALSTFFREEEKESGRPIGPRRLLGYTRDGFDAPVDSDPPTEFTQARAVVQLVNEDMPGAVASDGFYYIFATPKADTTSSASTASLSTSSDKNTVQ